MSGDTGLVAGLIALVAFNLGLWVRWRYHHEVLDTLKAILEELRQRRAP